MEKDPATPIQYIKGIGPKRAKAFNAAGIKTAEDLLYYFPLRYEDRTGFISISGIKKGETYTVKARILSKGEHHSFRRRGFSITEAEVGDATGTIRCVWFNQPYLKEYLKVGLTIILYGKVEEYAGRLQMSSPEFEIASSEEDESLNIGRITPVYPLPKGMTQRRLRQIIKYALDEYLTSVKEPLPYDLRSRNGLLNLAKSLLYIHFPDNAEAQKDAYKRLSFEEFFLFQIPLLLRKLQKKAKAGISHNTSAELTADFRGTLPFNLTCAQERAIAEISKDMARPFAMQRLLQGDVGSGKTVVATIAALTAIQGGYQAVFMVPTEILARQHYDKIGSQLESGAPRLKKIRLGLLTASATGKEKNRIYRQAKDGRIDLVIGTHALIEETVRFKNLGLIVIDEQHKFGVGQRALLPAKGRNPDLLIMTATPIPRTLAITLYGDLDMSVINELPPGRPPVKTMYFTQKDRPKVYDIARSQLNGGSQVYIVYPVIEESYSLDIAGAKKMYKELKSGEFRDFRVGLIHGRMKQDEQDEAMSRFKRKELDLLVSTTVLEVGIDIASATCMIIESAERFGLSQLHQLRGRVGRGRQESFCLLISDATSEQARARISAMIKYSDGFRIAEEDLKIRGPGEFFGRRQSGLSELRIANPLTQMQLLKRAREEASKALIADPRLESRQNSCLRDKLLQRFPEYDKLVMVG